VQVREKNAAGVEELQTVHRYAPNSGTDSCFGEISLVSGAKPYGGNIIARSSGATAGCVTSGYVKAAYLWVFTASHNQQMCQV